MYKSFVKINWKLHLFIGFILRLLFIIYGIYQDRTSTLPYTDIDYKVFTDAARYVSKGGSPYQRYTYRYSPLLAILLLPNIFLSPFYGKILFSLIDLLDGLLIKKIVQKCLENYVKKCENLTNFDKDFHSNLSLIFWLYNPLIFTISTRGNCDSIAVFLILSTVYVLENSKSYFIAGLLHGFSVHFRLYPIIFSLTFFMFLSKYSTYNNRKFTIGNSTIKSIENNQNKALEFIASDKKTIFQKKYLLYLVPNLKQFQFISGFIFSLSLLNAFFYYLYGKEFFYNSFLYHLIRNDYRHNFSLYFYLQYLTGWIKNIGVWQRVLINLPKIILLLVFSIRYGLNRFTFNFALLTQTIVFVTYNTVITSQYFVWIMAVLALCLWQIKMSLKKAIFFLIVWFAAQGAWLLPAYLLEFHGQNTFFFIWLQSVSFFCANIAILGRLILYFTPQSK